MNPKVKVFTKVKTRTVLLSDIRIRKGFKLSQPDEDKQALCFTRYIDNGYFDTYANALIAENERLQKQLDAAVEDLKDSIYNPYGCVYCKHQRIDRDTFYCDLDCDDEHNKFEWRGAERSE